MVGNVRTHKVIPIHDWTGHLSKMPLPDLIPDAATGRRNQAAFFDEPYLASADDLTLDRRIACLSQTGVNLLLQRWVHHNSRVLVETSKYQDVSSSAYEEADLIEEWCEDRLTEGLDIRAATIEAIKWLREDTDSGISRQQMLQDPQKRSVLRRQMRTALRTLR